MNRLLHSLLSVCLLSSIALAATCRNDSGSKQVIRAANEASYREIRDGRIWRNPEIVVGENGISVKFPESEVEKSALTIDQTLLLLSQQDCRVWPYGAVVMLSEAGIRSQSADNAAMRKMLLDLKKALEKDGIKADLWPSA
jgi:hypothetical protein